MRMHSVGKCSPNLVVGALTVFSLILLYNYWNVSAFNKDLLHKLHSLEEQAIALANANDAIRSSFDKSESQKSKLQSELQNNESSLQVLQSQIAEAQKSLDKSQKENDKLRKESKKLNTEIAKLKTSLESKDEELSTSKSKVVELQAQIKTLELKIGKLEKVQAQGSAGAQAPTKQGNDDSLQPVLMNDPAVPYPSGWKSPNWSVTAPIVHVKSKIVGNAGAIEHGLPVILFDSPDLPRKKARFSVANPPRPGQFFYKPMQERKEQQMNPEASNANAAAAGPPAAASKNGPNNKEKDEHDNNNGGEVNNNNEPETGGGGVLPVPGGNLDAAEDDGDHPIIGDHPLDDQSPDGAINNPKEPEQSKAVGPAPPPAAGAAGQIDHREAAHLQDLSLNNGL